MSSRFHDVLLGTALGDAIGLPFENLSAAKIAKRLSGDLGHSLLPGRGMCSDDTEQTVMLAQALLAHPNDPAKFAACFRGKLRWWLAAIPAGIGFGTLRAILLGRGVNSAGNGAAMRSAILGAWFADDPDQRRTFVEASARVTHTHPHAVAGARVVAEFAALKSRPTVAEFAAIWRSIEEEEAWQTMADSLQAAMDHSVADFAKLIGVSGFVTGWVMHSVPVAVYAWWRHHGDYRSTIDALVRRGGDTDSTAAIGGALAALSAQIPPEWIDGLLEWPRSVSFLRRLGDAMEAGSGPVSMPAWGILPRNLVFLIVILGHVVLRRFR